MATQVGQINFGVGIDASQVAAELNRELRPVMAKVQAQLNRNPLHLKAVIDVADALRIARLELKKANLSVDVKANISLDKTQVAALRELNKAQGGNSKFKVDLDIDQAKVAQLERIGPALRALRGLNSKDIKVKIDIDVDEAKLARVAAGLKELHNTTVKAKVDADTSGAEGGIKRTEGSLSSLSNAATRASSAGLNFGKWAAIFAGIGGAAGAAAGAVGGLAAAAAAAGPALAAIGATAVTGFQGIGDAFSALHDTTTNAAADARTQSDAVSAATVSMTSALDAAEQAQVSLGDAQDASAQAAKDVGDAYQTAQRRLDGYTTSLQQANLDEKEARLNLAEAQKNLAKGGFKTPEEYARAQLAVQQAQLNVTKAVDAGKQLQEDANKAQQQGLDQAPEVVAAKRAQKQADEQLVEAQKNVVRTQEAVTRAADDLAKAQAGAGTSSEKFADALANLSPNAQAFVLAAKDIAPTLEQIRKGVQDQIFAGWADQLKTTADVVLPAFAAGMGGVAAAINQAGTSLMQFAASQQGVELINAAFQGGAGLIRGFTANLGDAAKGLVDLANVAAPEMESIGKAVAGIADGFGRAFSSAAADGTLTKVLDGFASTLTTLGPLVENLTGGLLDIASKVMPVLGPFFASLGDQLAKIAGPLGDLGAQFITSLTPILPVLGDLISELGKNLVPILPVLGDLLKVIGDAVKPLIEPLSQIAQVIGTTLASVIKSLEPVLKPLADIFVQLFQAVAPIVELFANNLSVVLQALIPPLGNLIKALTPVIDAFAKQMMPVFEQLAPILAQVATQISDALISAITQIAPLIPDLATAFVNLIGAIAPFIPQLVQLAVQFIPPLVDILKVLIPVLTTLIDTFTWLVNNVITPILIPAIQAITQTFQDMFDQIGAAVDWAMANIFPKIQNVLQDIQGWFSDTVSAVGDSWSQLMDVAAKPVNFVIDTVWNNGLLKAWNSVDNLLGGVLPDAQPIPLIPGHATGGAIGLRGGSGNGTKDDILSWLSNGEHVVTASEVMAAGGQDILYAIRDMIARGIPFTWDNGQIITDLGRDNLTAYGKAVEQKGIGNVPPEGLFDSLIPQFATGGQIFPWMYQLQKGHDFARAQDGKPYQWAGPRFVGDSFDCSGFMGSIIAAIVGDNPWQRYWSTATFAGYPQVGAQGLTKNLTEGSGMAVGITDDPGGPGGGHTAGELRGVPELNIPAARVESGGALGDVHYGRGTDPNSFQSLYGLPIGANGFFQPTAGGDQNGPSTDTQRSFLHNVIQSIVDAETKPIKDLITSQIGAPPPLMRGIPNAVVDALGKGLVSYADTEVSDLGGALGGAWQAAKNLGSDLLSLNPFDSGGLASGTGFMPKNVIEPERVLSPEQTKMFEALVAALSSLAQGGLAAVGSAANKVTVDISNASVAAIKTAVLPGNDGITNALNDVVQAVSGDVLGPVLGTAFESATGVFGKLIDGLGKEVVGAVDGTTAAVNDVNDSVQANTDATQTPAFGMPGSAFDLTSALSDAVKSVSDAAAAAFKKVADDVINAALKQTPSSAGTESRGVLGKDISGGFATDFLVQLTGVEIQVRDLLSNTLDEVRKFRGDQFKAITATGEVVSDTAALVDRNQSSQETAAAEQNRINAALMKATVKYLVSDVLIPIITAVLSAMITIATTAIGAAIGSAIPVIGTAIGAAIGAAVGAGLSGLASTFVGLLAVGVGGALSAFDSGGMAVGTGYMPKDIVAPERVLSPRQTTAFETLVGVLDRGTAGNRTVQVGSMNVYGTGAASTTADNLLALLNT